MKTLRSDAARSARARRCRRRPGAQRGDAVYVEDRLNQLQQTITMLTGQLEQMQYRNQQLQQQMEKMQADYEFRLSSSRRAARRRRGRAAPPPSRRAGAARRRRRRQSRRRRRRPAAAARASALSRRLQAAAGRRLRRRRARLQDLRPAQSAACAGRQCAVLAGRDLLRAPRLPERDGRLRRGLQDLQASPKGPDNLLKLGVTLAVLNKKPEACAVFARFDQDYPRATDLQKRRIDQERQKNGCG